MEGPTFSSFLQKTEFLCSESCQILKGHMPLIGSLLLFSELESLLCARPCDKSFVTVLNHSIPWHQVLFLFPSYRRVNGGLKRLSHLLKVTRLVSGSTLLSQNFTFQQVSVGRELSKATIRHRVLLTTRQQASD